MMQQHALAARARTALGKGGARATRRGGEVPGIIYGGAEPPQPVAVDPIALHKYVQTGRLNALVLSLEFGSETNEAQPKEAKPKETKKESKKGLKKVMAVARGVSFHKVTDQLEHIDFLRVQERTQIHVETPVAFINHHLCQGLKVGGVLNIVRHVIELKCEVRSIPESIVVDLAQRRIGDTIHISMISLPEGVTPVITDRDFTVATLTAPRGLQVAEEETETEEEPEA